MNRVVIHSAPRSGSSWLGEIFNSSPSVLYKFQPLFSYRFKSFLDQFSSADAIDEFFTNLLGAHDDFLDQTEQRENGHKPIFLKQRCTHVVYKEVRYHYILDNLMKTDPDVKSILLIRNPFEVLVSFRNAEREFRKDLGWNFDEEWRFSRSKNMGGRESYFGYEKWKESALLFQYLQKKYIDQVMLIDYKELVENTHDIVRKMFSFSDVPLGKQTLDFINRSSCLEIGGDYSVFRSHKKIFSGAGLSEEIRMFIYDDLRGTTLEHYLEDL